MTCSWLLPKTRIVIMRTYSVIASVEICSPIVLIISGNLIERRSSKGCTINTCIILLQEIEFLFTLSYNVGQLRNSSSIGNNGLCVGVDTFNRVRRIKSCNNYARDSTLYSQSSTVLNTSNGLLLTNVVFYSLLNRRTSHNNNITRVCSSTVNLSQLICTSFIVCSIRLCKTCSIGKFEILRSISFLKLLKICNSCSFEQVLSLLSGVNHNKNSLRTWSNLKCLIRINYSFTSSILSQTEIGFRILLLNL